MNLGTCLPQYGDFFPDEQHLPAVRPRTSPAPALCCADVADEGKGRRGEIKKAGQGSCGIPSQPCSTML